MNGFKDLVHDITRGLMLAWCANISTRYLKHGMIRASFTWSGSEFHTFNTLWLKIGLLYT
jgi:hypothetical protein